MTRPYRRIKARSGKHLNRNERDYIERRLQSGATAADLAAELKRHPTTIYREIKRGTYRKAVRRSALVRYRESYSAETGQRRYAASVSNRGAKRRALVDASYRKGLRRVFSRMAEMRYSPYAAVTSLARDPGYDGSLPAVSLVYKAVHRGDFGVSEDILPRGRSSRRKARKRAPVAPGKRSIEERPADVTERRAFGHWEGDLVVGGKRTHGAFLTLVERMSRKVIVRWLPERTSDCVVAAIDAIEREYADVWNVAFRSCTWDNGPEFADMAGIERESVAKPLPERRWEELADGERWLAFYGRPYTSNDRGSNENANGILRRFFPKGADPRDYGAESASMIEAWFDGCPRKLLGGRPSIEVFGELCEAALGVSRQENRG